MGDATGPAADGVPLRRPMLKVGLRRLRRGPGALQIGIDPERAVVLTGLDEPGERWLRGVDGLRGRARLLAGAGEAGVDPGDAAAILDLLAAGGLLDDAAAVSPAYAALPEREQARLAPDLASLALVDRNPDAAHTALARRLAARVDVHGAGRVGASAAGLLAAAGVGAVRVHDHRPAAPGDLAPAGLRPRDLGGPRGWAATRAAERATLRAADVGAGSGTGPADLVLLATEEPVPAGLRDALIAGGVPHLVAYVRETVGVVGPLVLPRRSSCLLCHELIRTERDPAWPQLAAQLATEPSAQAEPSRVPPCDVVLATAVATHAALQALSFLEGGQPSTVDGTLEIALPEGTLRRRSWQRHPACGCGWADWEGQAS